MTLIPDTEGATGRPEDVAGAVERLRALAPHQPANPRVHWLDPVLVSPLDIRWALARLTELEASQAELRARASEAHQLYDEQWHLRAAAESALARAVADGMERARRIDAVVDHFASDKTMTLGQLRADLKVAAAATLAEHPAMAGEEKKA